MNDRDELLKYIRGETTAKNPNYNKRKKNSPKYIKVDNLNDYNTVTDKNSLSTNYETEDISDLGYRLNDKTKNIRISANDSDADINRRLAESQSNWKKTGNMLMQGVFSEVAIGTLLGISNLVDAGINLFTDEKNDFTNPVSKMLEDSQEYLRDKFEIYRKNPDEAFDFNDFGWYANNLVSVFSTASLMMPSMGITKLGKLASASKVGRGVSKAIQKGLIASKVSNPAKIMNTVSKATEIGSNAFLSRTMENYLEARDVYKNVEKEWIDKLNNDIYNQKEKLLEQYPELRGQTNEEIASYIANKSANKTFIDDFSLLFLDIAQFKGLNKIIDKSANKSLNAAQRIAHKNTIRSLTGKDALSNTFINRLKENVVYNAKNPLRILGSIEGSEAIEEAIQGINTEKGFEVSKMYGDINYNPKSILDYATDLHILEQAAWGSIGGVVFKQLGKGLSKVKEITSKDKNKFNDDFIEQTINSRNDRLKSVINALDLLNQGKNPLSFKYDTATGDTNYEDPNNYEDIKDENKDAIKDYIINEFITDYTLDAVDNGMFDIQKEFLTSNEVKKYIGDNIKNVSEKELEAKMFSKMNSLANEYEQLNYDIYSNAKADNPYVIRMAARKILRNKENYRNLQELLNETETKINEALDGQTLSIPYYNGVVSDYIHKEIDKINKQINKLEKDFKDGLIHKLSYEAIKKDYNDRIEEINQLNSEIQIETKLDLYEEPKDIVDKLIKQKITILDGLNNANNKIPKNKEDFNREYKEASKVTDSATIKLYNDAIDTIKLWLDEQPNLDKAMQDLISGNVPENVEKASFIFNNGIKDNNLYLQSLQQEIKSLYDKRNKEAEKEKTVINNGDKVTDNKSKEIKEKLSDKERKVEGDKGQTNPTQIPTKSQSNPIEDLSIEEDIVNEDNNVEEISSETPKPISKEERMIQEQIEANIDEEEHEDERTIKEIDKIITEESEYFYNSLLYASDVAYTETFKYYRENKDLFVIDEVSDESRSNVEAIISIIEERIDDRVNPSVRRKAAVEGVQTFISSIYKSTYKDKEYADKAKHFKYLVDTLATMHEFDEFSSSVKSIPMEQIDEVIENVIDSYIQAYNIRVPKSGKPIINLENLFNHIIEDADITYIQALQVYDRIRGFIFNNKNRYVFTSKRKLSSLSKNPIEFFEYLKNSKSSKERIDDKLHFSISRVNKNSTNTLEKALNKPVSIGYTEFERGIYKGSLSIKFNGEEIGFLGAVVPNSNNNEFRLAAYNKGFRYIVSNTEDGVFFVNDRNLKGELEKGLTLEEFFRNIIYSDDLDENTDNFEDYKFIRDLIDKYISISYSERSVRINKEDADRLVNLPVIKDLVSRGYFTYYSNNDSNMTKANFLLSSLANIIHYDINAENNDQLFDSFISWKYNIYSNYKNTYEIQQRLERGDKIETTLSTIGVPIQVLTADDVDVKSLPFNHIEHKMVVVDDTGNYLSDVDDIKINNYFNLGVRQMGLLIYDRDRTPIIARMTKSNTIASNPKYSKAIIEEFERLLNKMKTDKHYVIEDFYNDISKMFIDNKENSGLFYNVEVIFNKDRFGLRRKGRKDFDLVITKDAESIDRNALNNVMKYALFNRSMFAIKHKNDFNIDLGYIGKKDGKMYVKLGNMYEEYDSFAHFIIKENAFKTNQGTNKNGKFYDYDNSIKSLYLKLDFVQSPVKGEDERFDIETIKELDKDTPIETSKILTNQGVDKPIIDLISGNNEYNLSLIPNLLYYDKYKTKAYAYYSKGKMFITNTGISLIKQDSNSLIKLLIHEKMHDFIKHNNTLTDEVVNEILEVYEYTVSKINEIIQDKTNPLYNRAIAIKEWIEETKYNPNEYFTNLSAEDRRKYQKLNDSDKLRVFAEEFIVESLTQKPLIDFMSQIDYKEEVVEHNKNTIWDKIINILLKLFNLDIANKNKNSIFAKQISIISNSTNEVKESEIVKTDTKEEIDYGISDDNNDIELDENSDEILDNINIDDLIDENDTITDIDVDNDFDDLGIDDDLTFYSAVSSIEEDIDLYKNNTKINPNGYRLANGLDKYIESHKPSERSKIAQNVGKGLIKFVC